MQTFQITSHWLYNNALLTHSQVSTIVRRVDMSVPGIVKLQLGLSVARLVVLGIGLTLFITGPQYPLGFIPYWIVPMGVGCLNDLVLLSLDFFVYGSIFTTVILQHIVSLTILVLSLLIAYVDSENASACSPFDALAAFLSFIFLILTTRAWILKPDGSWKLGIKDVEYHRGDSSFKRPRLLVFGRRRPSDDKVKKIPRLIWRGMKLMIFRRREGIESVRFSVFRNITAIFLLLSLAAQSISLFYNVIYEQFEIKETRDQPSSNYLDQHLRSRLSSNDVVDGLSIADVDIYYNDTADPRWTSYAAYGPRNYSWEELLQYEAVCNHANCSVGGDDGSGGYLHIGMVAEIDSTGGSGLSPMWICLKPHDDDCRNQINFGGAFQMVPGSYLVGLIEVSFRKQIHPTLVDMLGFTPWYDIFPLLSINWVTSMPLKNTKIARVSLSFSQQLHWKLKGSPYKFNIIQDVRKNTFLSALSTIGGLLAVFQAFHLLCFGMPLFWGLSGGQLLDPFGLFGSGTSNAVRQRMIARYGFIPGDPGNSNVHGLSLFLREFVLNFGPLSRDRDSESEVIQQAEEGEITPPSSAVEKENLIPFTSGVEERAPQHDATIQRRSDDHNIEMERRVATPVNVHDMNPPRMGATI